MKIMMLLLPCCALLLSACGSYVQPCKPDETKDVVYVTEQGWHAEIGIPVSQLTGNLAFYRTVFPGARVIMFGYGKKTFFTAPPETISEYVLGPFPGTAVLHTVALSVTPLEAYPPESTVALALPPGSSKALSEFIWDELSKDTAGNPKIVAHSTNPAGLFYAANSEYNLLHTCNSWTADALHAAGLPIHESGVIFSGQVMTQVNNAADSECKKLTE